MRDKPFYLTWHDDPQELKELSCGVIVVRKGQVLIEHVCRQTHWDLPKGTQKLGETPRDTALRKLKEETAIEALPEELIDIGWYHYNSFKDLYLFALFDDDLSEKKMYCCNAADKAYYPDDYQFVPPEQLPNFVCQSLEKLLYGELFQHIEKLLKSNESRA